MTSPTPAAENLLSQTAPTYTKIDNQVSQSKLAVNERPFFPGLINAFGDSHELTSIKNQLWLSGFLLVNVALSRLQLLTDYFSSVGGELLSLCAVLFGILSLPLSLSYLYGALKRVLAGLHQRTLHPEILAVCSVTSLTALTFHSLIFDRAALTALRWDSDLIVLIFAISATRLFDVELFGPLRDKIGFGLTDLVPYAERLKMSPVGEGMLSVSLNNEASSNLVGSNNNGVHPNGPLNLSDSMIAKSITAGIPPKEKVNVQDLKIGDLVSVTAGDYVPSDGIIIDGKAQLSEIRFTAHSELCHRHIGDSVFAGSKVLTGGIVVRVTALFDEPYISTFSNILNSKISSGSEKDIERTNFTITFATFFVLVAGLCAALVWGAKGSSFSSVAGIFSAIAVVSIVPKVLSLNFYLKSLAESTAFKFGALAPKNFLVDCLSSVKTLIFDYRPNSEQWLGEVVGIDIIDQRIDEHGLFSAIFSLTGRANSPTLLAVNQFLAKKFSKLRLLDSTDLNEYAGKGICAVIDGCELSIGDENFLLERGVLMQESELRPASVEERVLYVALDDELIARINIAPPLSTSVFEAVRTLTAQGIRTLLCSMEPGEDLDRVGKRMGLELSNVFGGLHREVYLRKLDTVGRAAFFMNNQSDPEVVKRAAISISQFDELLWDLNRSDVLLFNRNSDVIARLFRVANSYRSVALQNLVFATALTLVMIGMAIFGLITPVISALAMLTGSVAILLNSYRLVS